jgi:hypothetical protein
LNSIERRQYIRLALIAASLLALIPLVIMLRGWLPGPQMKPDPDVFKSVDALFTAVTSQNAQRLDECKGRLQVYRDEGRLPADSADRLDDVIRRAESGSWDSAAKRLYGFIERQRNEDAVN